MNVIRSRDLQPRPQPASVAALTVLLISGSQSDRSVECQKWLIMSRLWLSLFIVNTSEYMNMNWFGIVIWGSFSSNLIVRLCFYFPCPDHHYKFKMIYRPLTSLPSLQAYYYSFKKYQVPVGHLVLLNNLSLNLQYFCPWLITDHAAVNRSDSSLIGICLFTKLALP